MDAADYARLMAEGACDGQWIPMVGRTEEVDWEAWERQKQHRANASQDAWARAWADDATRYAPAAEQEARDLRNWFTDKPPTPRTITLQPGEYWWSAAPTYCVPGDFMPRILGALGAFEREFRDRPLNIGMNEVTGDAIAVFLIPGRDPEPISPDAQIFGIPIDLNPDVPTGTIRLHWHFAYRDIPLDPGDQWWFGVHGPTNKPWGTYGNPLLRPTGI